MEDENPARPVADSGQLPIIGLGGSAGSIQALRTFFAAAPEKSGLAYVVVIHLAAHRDSSLAELLQRETRLPVHQVTEAAVVEPDHVYVIPPGKSLSARDGELTVADLPDERGRRVAVDLFFRSLAESHGPQAMAIVLSGADGDGAIGIKRIKERGGLTVAQDPDEAEFSGMPRSAIATGMVDWVLPVAEMPERLVRYRDQETRLRLPADQPPPAALTAPTPDSGETALREVLKHLRTLTGHDFACYKRSTILRRLAKRLRVNELEHLDAYLVFLRTHPGEAGALLQDLLISVTNFFRDADAFEALAAQIDGIVSRHGEEPIRVWVPACATGEEAYSIAMLLAERLQHANSSRGFQIFATDLDEAAVAAAREAIYPTTISADVSESRLRRFFAKDLRGWRVRSELRERVLFAHHDLLRDSPFSRLDLLSCRNLLIYLDVEAQARVLDIAHFALRADGRLFLGVSETAEHAPGFRVVDKRHRIYAPLPTPRTAFPVPLGQNGVLRALEPQPKPLDRPVPAVGDATPQWTRPARRGGESRRDLHLRLIEALGPPSLLIDEQQEIVHVSEQAGRFLQVPGGEPSKRLLSVVHPSLAVEMRTALARAAAAPGPVETAPLAVEIGGEPLVVTLRVARATNVDTPYFVVAFDTRPSGSRPIDADGAPVAAVTPAARDRVLEGEIEELKWHLRELTERRDLAIEELKAGNEELQAMNEELRSATEELETSREELQSINEELTTVNQEMNGKVEELGRTNADLQNLIAATAVAAVFLTRDLRITRFTPSAVALFNLIAGDIGRPLADLATSVDYPDVATDAAAVLETLVPRDREVQAGERWYLARMLPYRTVDDHIGGVVLTFNDITTRRMAEAAMRLSEQRYRDIVAQAAAGVAHLDLERRVTLANGHVGEAFGMATEALLGHDLFGFVDADDRPGAEQGFARMLQDGEPFDVELRKTAEGGEAGWVLLQFSLLRDVDGTARSAIAVVSDVSARKRAEAETQSRHETLRVSERRMRDVLDNAVEFAIISMDLDRRVIGFNAGAVRMTGFEEEDVIGQPGDVIFTHEDRDVGVPQREAATALREGRAADDRWHVRADGTRFWGSGVMMPIRNENRRSVGLLKIFRDITETRETQQALETSRSRLVEALAENVVARQQLEEANLSKDRFLAMLSHELRTPLTPVVMATTALERSPGLSAEALSMTRLIRRNVTAEMTLIDDLLDVTRIASGKLTVAHEPVDLHAMLEDALQVCAEDAQAKQQKLVIRLDAGEHLVEGDYNRLRQATWNLVKNASKFTPRGGTITVTTANPGGGRVSVAIADTGIGVDIEKLPTIFDAFMQGGERITREYGGLGLGLAIVRALIEAHGGTLRAESAGQDRGSVFTYDLPLAIES